MKKLLLYVCILFIGLFLSSCDVITGPEIKNNSNSGTKTQYHYYEMFRVSKRDFYSVPAPGTLTFGTIKTFRNALKYYSVEFIGSGTDAIKSDIYSLLTQRGMTPTEANHEISIINSVGNNVLLFEYTINHNYYLILYLEKL